MRCITTLRINRECTSLRTPQLSCLPLHFVLTCVLLFAVRCTLCSSVTLPSQAAMFPPQLLDLLSGMLDKNPATRLTVEQIKVHAICTQLHHAMARCTAASGTVVPVFQLSNCFVLAIFVCCCLA